MRNISPRRNSRRLTIALTTLGVAFAAASMLGAFTLAVR